MVVLDTNVIIDFLEGKEKVVAAINKHAPSELATTFVNQYELLKHSSKERSEEPLSNLLVYQSSETAMHNAAKAYKQLKSSGKIISDNDLMIFGVCVANNEILLTQDKGFLHLDSERVKLIE
ncbi:MAG: type II toxin-antitoxin system VapC family toxin [Candidatus Marsarchaeota archaeon]|nr:type II toxin-antitoxin system VapC family toxin [Candidatus Marsarchaeota archaeon]MCL5111300.1 type II toxin-antitoxin system VapC family toxin [Candidatus Marsarchaeota archaeon]